MGVIFHKGKKYGGTGVKVQSDASATSLNPLDVPNGQTMTSYLNSNLVFDLYDVNISVPANNKAELEITSTIAKTGYDVKMVTVYSISSTIMPVIELSGSRYFVLARNFATSGTSSTTVYVAVMYKKSA